MPQTRPTSPLVVGFDLDMTLIDTVPGFGATLLVLGTELGVDFPVADMTARLGPPLETLLSGHLDEQAVGPAGDRFRALYPEHAIESVPALAGAHEALAAVRRHGGRIVVVTGKYPDNARLHVEHLSLDVDHVEGWVWGVGKADALRREGAAVYVGDHVHDVEGALAAGVLSVSVLTGGCTRAELVDAGTHVVLEHLGEFPAWLEEHLLGSRLAALEAGLRSHGSVLVALSGGAAGGFLLAAAVRALGTDRVVAVTGDSHPLPGEEQDRVRAFAESLGVEVLDHEAQESERLDLLTQLAADRGLARVTAALDADDGEAERGTTSPLRDAGLTTAQVREASRRWGLPTWDEPVAAGIKPGSMTEVLRP